MAVADVKGASRNLIRTSVPNLISGVSQQADSFKLSTQAFEQINAVSSVVDGLIKRPATTFSKEVSYNRPGSSPTYPYGENGVAVYPKLTPLKYFKISTSELEDYIGIVFHNPTDNAKSIKIFDLLGNEKNVIYHGGNQNLINSYLSGITTEALGSSLIKTLSIADYTFFLNSSKTTAIANDISPRARAGINGTEVYQGMVVVKTGYTGRSATSPRSDINWSVKIVGINNVVYATASGNSDAWNSGSSTGGVPTTIATDISTKLNAGFQNNFGSSGRVAVSGSNVIVQHPNLDFKIIVDDGYAGTIFYSIKDNVQNFTDLPVIAPHKFLTKITGLPDSSGDEYYVEHLSNYTGEFLVGGANTSPVGIFAVNEGPWQETRSSGIQYKLDSSSMPHAIVRLDSNNFLFTPLNGETATYNLSPSGSKQYTAPSWGSRDSGDLESNPNPSFIGKSITNLFFFKNRLGFLSGESVVLSQAGEFFNFFKSTTAQVLDSDPIDITSSTTEIGNLYHAIPFYDRVVLFADGLQFSLQSDGELTSKSVSLQQSTSFDVDVFAEPIAIGSKIYFSATKSNFSSVQEYFINPNTILLDGIDITANIPSYLNGRITQFIGSDISSILLTLNDTNKHEVGVYKFFYSGEEKIQSAWSKWSFGINNNVKFAYISKDKIYFVIEKIGLNQNQIEFLVLNLDTNTKDLVGDPNIQVLLDSKTSNFTYNSQLSNNDGTFSLITLNNKTFEPLTISNVKTSSYINNYELSGFTYTLNDSTSLFTNDSFVYNYNSNFDLKISKFKLGSGLINNGSFISINPVDGITPNSASLALSQNKFIEFSITLGKYKSFYFTGFSNLNFQVHTGANANQFYTLYYSQNNVDFIPLNVSSQWGLGNFNITPVELKGSSEEKKYYFRITMHSSNIEQRYKITRSPAPNPAFTGLIIPSYQSISNYNFGTTGIMYNKSPYQFVNSSGVVFDTYYAVFNSTTNQFGVSIQNQIGYCSHNKLWVKTNLTASSTGIVGLPYSMFYEISRPVLRSASGKGQSVVGDGRLQIKNGILIYDNSRFFQVLVTPKYRDTYNYTYLYNFVPNYLGVGPTNLDYMHMEDGVFKFPVFCKSDEVKISVLNESPYPCALLSLEWEALYSARSKRIG